MTTLDALLAELTARGVTVAAHGDRLKVDAPAGAITPELRARLAEHKAALLAHLTGDAEPTTPAPPAILHRIPLDLNCTPSEWLAARGLRVIGGTPFHNGRFRPTLFVADIPPAPILRAGGPSRISDNAPRRRDESTP